MTAATPNLFRNIPEQDVLGFWQGAQFQPQRVYEFLDLKKADVSRIADVSPKSVRWEEAKIPAAVREHFEQIAVTCNLVAEIFGGDQSKTALWFKAKNPLLGDVTPRDMVRLGRFDRLRKFIISAMMERPPIASGPTERR